MYVCKLTNKLSIAKPKLNVIIITYAYTLIVPIPFVYITISDNDETSGDNTSRNSILQDFTVGDPLTLDCTATAVRGISSSVDIIWTTGGRVVRRVDNITADIENDYAIYTDSFEISSLSAIDNGREYQCTVVINASQPVYNSDNITLIFPGKCNINICAYQLHDMSNAMIGIKLLIVFGLEHFHTAAAAL